MQTHAATRLLWLLGVGLCLIYFHHPFPGSGVNARLDTVFAVVDAGTLSIDSLHENTHDKARIGGRFYSDKPPLPALAGVPVLAAIRAFDQATGRRTPFRVAGYWITALTVTASALGLALLLRRHLAAYGDADESQGVAAFVATVYVLGTPALVYAGLFFPHQLTAALAFGGFACVFRRARTDGAGIGWTVLGGLLAGLAILSEYPAGLIAVWLVGYVAYTTRRTTDVVAFLAAAFVLPALLLGAYNQVAFGSPFSLGYDEPFLDIYSEAMGHGLFGVTVPRLSSLVLVLLSPSRGLLYLSPVLVLAVPGLVRMIRDRRWRAEGALVAAVAVGHLLFNSAYHQPGGGTCYGPRHLVPIVPFLMVPVAFWLRAASRPWRTGALVLAALSVVITASAVAIEPFHSERVLNPLPELVAPLAAAGDRADNLAAMLGVPGAASLLPFAVVCALLLWATGRRLRAEAPPTRSKSAVPALVIICLVAAHAAALNLVRTDEGIRAQVLGNHYSGREQWDRSAAWYERARELRSDPYVLYYLGRAYLKAGDVPAARETYRDLLTAAPAFPEAERVRAILEAIDRAEKEVKMRDDRP